MLAASIDIPVVPAQNQPAMRPYLATALLVGALAPAGCTKTDALEMRFVSAAQRQASTEVRVFLFGGPDGTAPGCTALDPRGQGPGDAAARTGLEPAFAETGPLDDDIAEFPDVPAGTYSLVIEAWGPPCEEVRSGESEPVCAQLTPTEPSVLRAYFCNEYEIGPRRLDAVADLESFTDVGATMAVPTGFPANAERYGEDAPLLVADGLPARDRFLVQLLSGTADEEDGVAVRFTVESGSGSLVEPQPVLTQEDDEVQDKGLAGAVLRTNTLASSAEEARVVVSAYAPGYEGAPVRFYARAVPNVNVQVEAQEVPATRAAMADLDNRAVPVALADLDADGRLDLVTVAGGAQHQLVIQYGGRADVHVSALQPRQARALAVARLAAGAPPSVVVSTAVQSSGTFSETPHGPTYIIEEPRLEIWRGLAPAPASLELAAPQVLDALDGVPIEKVAIAMSARDLDDDGLDEIALTRCSYMYQTDAGQSRFVRCLGRVIDKTDNELALLRVENGALSVKAVIPGQDNEGGFREPAFGDINGDNSIDLVFASNSEVHGVCGRRVQGAIGYGFDAAMPFDTTSTFGGSYSVAVGNFDDDPRDDLVVSGAIRAASTDSGFKVIGGESCEAFDQGPPSLRTGSKTQAHLLIVRAADVNQDGIDDVLLLHRNTRVLQVFLGGGNLNFAAGPTIDLPAGYLGELAVGIEDGEVVAATVAPNENRLFRIRFTPGG